MTTLSKTFTKRWIAPAAVAALTIAGSPLAFAGSQAYTQLDVTDGIFFRADTGNALVLGVDITIVNFEERGQVTANRIEGAGAGFSADTGIDTNPNDGVHLGPTALGAANIDQVCVGTGCGGAPNFPNPFVEGNINTDEHNRAALLVNGTGLDLTTASGGAIGVDPNSTQLVAEAITQGSSNDIAISSLANSTRFTVTFTAEQDVAVGFSGIVERSMHLFLDDEANSGTAAGNINFAFSVFNVTTGTIVDLTNNLAQLNLSTQTPGAGGEINFNNVLNYSTQTTTALVAGNTYQMTLNWDVRSDLNVAVPEPAPLGLLGLGLLAVPLVRRWKARG